VEPSESGRFLRSQMSSRRRSSATGIASRRSVPELSGTPERCEGDAFREGVHEFLVSRRVPNLRQHLQSTRREASRRPQSGEGWSFPHGDHGRMSFIASVQRGVSSPATLVSRTATTPGKRVRRGDLAELLRDGDQATQDADERHGATLVRSDGDATSCRPTY